MREDRQDGAESDLRVALAVLERLARDEYPGDLVDAARTWGGASDAEVEAMQRLGIA